MEMEDSLAKGGRGVCILELDTYGTSVDLFIFETHVCVQGTKGYGTLALAPKDET
jgi:hypothetical protein